MLRRFIHLGDLHLGPHARNADRIEALKFVVEENRNTNVAAWLWPGDLNHGRMTIVDKNALTYWVRQMANEAPVVIGYGNHDLPGDLDFLAHLSAKWPIHVVGRPHVLTVALPDGGWAVIFVLPYPTRAGLVAAGTAPGDVVEQAKLALNAIFLEAASKLRTYANAASVPLVIGHVNVGGSIMSAGQPNIGKEIELDPVLLQHFPHMYVGLNHIHKAQDISGAVYAGSMCRLDWAEVDPKGYVEITYGPSSWAGYSGDGPTDGCELYAFDWCRRPIPVPGMWKIDGDLSRDGFAYRIEGCDCGETWCAGVNIEGVTIYNCETSELIPAGEDIRVRFRFNAVEKDLLNFDLVKIPFAAARRLETDPIAIRDRAARAPEVMSATTLDAKVQAYVTAANQPWTTALDLKLAAIQKPDWDALALAAVGREAA